MKSKLPYLSALALAAIAAAATAQRPLAHGPQETRVATAGSRSGGDPFDSTAPYSSEPAAPASASSEEDDGLPVGDRLLRQAVRQLEQHDSVSAKLRHQVSLDGGQFYGSGSFCQQGRGDDLQTRLELQIAGQEASLLQTSNGRFLWIDRRLPTGRVVTCIELHKLRADLNPRRDADSPAPDEWTESYVEPLPPRSPDNLLVAVSGGLHSLLASLGENFDFLPPQAMRLSMTPPSATQSVEVPVFAVVGHWKPARLSGLLYDGTAANDAQPGGEGEKKKPIPERIPQEVLLLFGQSDLFPYRLEYRGLETPPANEASPVAIYQLSANPLVVLELSEVKFDAPIAAGLFDYTPANAIWSYQTPAIRDRLRGQRQQKVADKSRPASR